MSERILGIPPVSRNTDGSPHGAPLGLRRRGNLRLLAPFRSSRTLDNLSSAAQA